MDSRCRESEETTLGMKRWLSSRLSTATFRVSDFKKLKVWAKAHALAVHAHRVATGMRRSQDQSLRGQIIRAAMSIPANIVEGRRQESEKEFARFLRIALNSGCELEYHLILARDIGAMSPSDADSLLRECIEVRRMLHGLLNKLGGRPAAPKSRSASMQAPSK
jgi:four helix bundle protein